MNAIFNWRAVLIVLVSFSDFHFSFAQVDSCERLICMDPQIFTINFDDSIMVTPGLLLEEPWCRDGEYKIEYIDDIGQSKPFDYVHAELRGEIEVDILNTTFGLLCEPTVIIRVHGCGELFRPKVEFRRYDLDCGSDTDPWSVGLPIPDTAHAIEIDGRIVVKGWNLCEDIELSYADWVTSGNCQNRLDQIIVRQWQYNTDDGRTFMPVDTIYVHMGELPDIDTLPNFNGITFPALNCEDDWNDGSHIPGLDVSAPEFEYAIHCSNIGFEITDSVIEETNLGCYHYSSFIRKTALYDWCTADFKEYFQHIVVECGEDVSPPVAVCHADIVVGVSAGDTTWLQIEDVDNSSYDDCGIETFSFSLDSVQKAYPITEDDDNITVTMYVIDYFGKINSCDIEVGVRVFTSTTDLIESSWKAFPNPTNDFVYIESEVPSNLESITWLDRYGQEIDYLAQNQLSRFSNLYKVSIPEHANSTVLFLRAVTDTGEVFVKKVVKL